MDRKVIIILTVLLLIVGMVLTMHSSYFEVKSIQVIGTDILTEEEVIAASGVSKGLNIFLLPGRETANRLMNYVRIKGVKLERDLPDTLIIRINERAGLGLFPTEDNRWMELSLDGTLLEVYDAKAYLPSLPRITGISPAIRGQQVKMTENLSKLLFLLKELHRLGIVMTSVSYHMEDLQVRLKSGTLIHFGHIASIEQNLTIFEKTWLSLQISPEKIKYFDFRYTGKPVYGMW